MYVSDGTPGGTVHVPYPLPAAPPGRFIPVGSETVVFPFESSPGSHGFLLTDGTLANTRLLGTIPALDPLHELAAVAADGLLFFGSYDGIHSQELWCTDLGATAEPEGHGCGGSEVVLVAGDPWLGRDWRCRVSTSLPLAALVLGAAAWPPLPVGWSTCFAYVDLRQPSAVASLPAGSQAITLRLPSSRELLGLRVGAQAVAGPVPPLGVALSNGLRMTLK